MSAMNILAFETLKSQLQPGLKWIYLEQLAGGLVNGKADFINDALVRYRNAANLKHRFYYKRYDLKTRRITLVPKTHAELEDDDRKESYGFTFIQL